MLRTVVNATILVALFKLVGCQFGFQQFGNQQQSYPFQQTGFQRANQNFAFPDFLSQSGVGFPNYQNGGRPQNNPQTNQNQQPPIRNNNPWFYPDQFQEPTERATQRPATFSTTRKVINQQIPVTAPPFHIQRGISKTKCEEYSELIKKKIWSNIAISRLRSQRYFGHSM